MAFNPDLCRDYWAPFATSVTTSTVAAILTLVTMPGNLLICWAVIRNPTRKLNSPFNYLVLNLAVADLIIGAVTDPMFVAFHVNEALGKDVLGIVWVVHVSYFLTSTASVASIVALAVNRYQTVTSNRAHRSKLSNVVVTSALVWIVSLGLPLLYLAVGFYMLAFIFANASLVIAAAVLIFVYCRVYHSLEKHKKNSAHIRSSHEQEKHTKRDEKATNSLLLIIVSFVMCALPSCAMVYVINLCHTCSCVLIHWFRDIQFLFLLVNAASNQFLYAWRMPPFQQAFKTLPAVQWLGRKFQRERIHPVTSTTSQTDSMPL